MSLLPITIEQTNQILEALPEDHQLHLQFVDHLHAGFVVREPRVHPLRCDLQ